MKTHIVSGSHRLNSQSLKISKYLQRQIEKQGGSTTLTDLSRSSLPLWDERMWEGDVECLKMWSPIAEQLKAADSVIIVVPEYHGMAAPAMKNFFLYCTSDLVAHKPALLVSVSAGQNGSYPIAEMRSSSYKNCRINYIPDHVIVRDANHVLNDDAAVENATDEFIRKKITYGLVMLEQYEKALKQVRESGAVNLKDHPNGM